MEQREATTVDVAREAARGRYASRVSQITRKGWRDILRRVPKRMEEHSLSLIAGGVSFFLILSIFPALAAVAALWGLLADPAALQDQLATLRGVLPDEALALLETALSRFVDQGNTRLGIAFLTGFAVTFWFANAGLKALFVALNVVYEEKEKRSFVRFNLASFRAALALFVVGLLLMGVTVASPIVLGRLGLGDAVGWAVAVLRWPTLLVAATLSLMIVYRIGPSRQAARWRWLGWGSAFTALAWLVASGIFSFYIAHFADYNVTYGSLGAVIGFMLWIYVSVFVLLIGAELNAEIEHQLATDTTVGPGRPMGRRGAYRADTLAPALVKPGEDADEGTAKG